MPGTHTLFLFSLLGESCSSHENSDQNQNHGYIACCSFTTYFPDLARTLEKSLNNRMGRPLKIRPSHLQDTAILLGGIYVVLKEFLKVENLRLKPAVTENDM